MPCVNPARATLSNSVWLITEAFSEAFAFEETEDQLAAINAVYRDMISDKPMDRLVCGDVGW